MQRYLIEGATKRDSDDALVVAASADEQFETDEQAEMYAEFVRNECKFDVVTVWKCITEMR